METLFFVALCGIFLGLLAVMVWLCLQYGTINVDPQHIAVRRNVWNGKLKELGPGLRFFIPGLYEIFKMVDCRQVIIDSEPLIVTSRDSQPIEVDYQITLWVDGFHQNNNSLKEGQAIKAATKIGEQGGVKGKDTDDRFQKDLETLGLKESNVAVQNMIGNQMLNSLIGGQTSTTTGTPDLPDILCPNCGRPIKKDQTFCQEPSCSKSKEGAQRKALAEKLRVIDKFKIPLGLYERLSWGAGIALSNLLEEKYGLRCYLKIRSVRYPKDTESAARARKIAEMEGDATIARFGKEATAFHDLIEKTHVSPDIAFLGGKIIEGLREIAPIFGGGRRRPERTEKGGSK